MLVDEGLLHRAQGVWAPAGDLGDIPVPPTIGALLGARLDRLDPAERDVTERGAVIGQEFYRGAVRELSPDAARAALDERLEALVHRELVELSENRFAGEDAFRFRHILVRDAAYNSTLKSLRADLHEGVGAPLGTGALVAGRA